MIDVAQRQALRSTMLLHKPDVASATAKEVLELLDAMDEMECENARKAELLLESWKATGVDPFEGEHQSLADVIDGLRVENSRLNLRLEKAEEALGKPVDYVLSMAYWQHEVQKLRAQGYADGLEIQRLKEEAQNANALLMSIKSMKFNAEDNRWHGDCDLEGALAHYLCMMIYEHFVECRGVNYVEQSVFHAPTNDAFDVLIQRRAGKTPAEVNADLRVENALLKAELEEALKTP